MISLATISLSSSWKISCKEIVAVSASIYEIACAIFRVVMMACQYLVVKMCVTLRRWCWLYSALPRKNLKETSRNIANLDLISKCLSTAWCPYLKNRYHEVGRAYGLRITSNIIFRPASGLCLGKSFTFLSEYLFSKEIDDKMKLITAARSVREQKNEKSIELQAIYDALMGIQGTVRPSEKEYFSGFLQEKKISRQDLMYPELLASIKSFLSIKDHSKSLREFVLNDIENKNLEITTDLYALILELDTIWYLQQHPGEMKNDSVHHAMIQAVADVVQLEVVNSTRLYGEILVIRDQLRKYEIGSYLVLFPNHTLAMVKGLDYIALFEPNEGLALLQDEDQQEGVSQLLEYYGSHDRISLKILAIQPR